MTVSALDAIPGLGATRRKALLTHFGSLKRLAAATPEEITEVPGIGRRTAQAITQALNGDAAPDAASTDPAATAAPARTDAVATAAPASTGAAPVAEQASPGDGAAS